MLLLFEGQMSTDKLAVPLMQINAATPGIGEYPSSPLLPDTKEIAMTDTIGRRLLLACTFAALAGGAAVAMAQPAAGPGSGMMGGGGPGMMGGGGTGMMGGRGRGMMGGYWNTGTFLDGLKTQLAITPHEEPAWKEYADTISGIGEQMQGLHQTMFESMGTASWQERRNLMNQMFQARQQAFDMVQEAANKLMSALDPTQKAKARSILPGYAYGPGMMGQG